MALILDTGPLYAALDRSDADHAACRRLLESATEPKLATLDRRHFGTLRPRHVDTLALLPLDGDRPPARRQRRRPPSGTHRAPPHPTSNVHASSSSRGAVATPITRSAAP